MVEGLVRSEILADPGSPQDQYVQIALIMASLTSQVALAAHKDAQTGVVPLLPTMVALAHWILSIHSTITVLIISNVLMTSVVQAYLTVSSPMSGIV